MNLYPAHFEKKIGFDKIREFLKNFCLSDLGKQKIDDLTISFSFAEIETALFQTAEFKQICLFEDSFPTDYFIDIRIALKKIHIEGTYLEVSEIFDLRRSLDTIKAILRFFKTKKDDEYPYLRKLTSDVIIFPFIVDSIDKILNKHGEIKDSASPSLQQIRKKMQEKKNAISKIMHHLLSQAKSQGVVEEDCTLTIRDGKALIPVSATNKRKIKGIVYDESATGKTSYIEPLESIELNNELRELEFEERREILQILLHFADSLRPYLTEILNNYDFLAAIDFIRAKALFSIDIQAVKPNLSPHPKIDLRLAKHPLLFLSLRREGEKVVPLDIEINENQRVILISGPNAGGKSVCLKTVGLLQYFVQCGLLIPASENSEIGIFEKLFIDIGDEQSIENDLSTYSSHLRNMKFFVENSNEKTLILIDEFGAGTEPMLGGAIAESILFSLNSLKIKGVITTHYTNLKHFASENSGIENGAMLFNNVKLEPFFELRVGVPGSSFALEIARKIGLSEQILNKSIEKIGKEHINFEKQIRDLEEAKREVVEQQKIIAKLRSELEINIENFKKEKEILLKQRKEIIEKTRLQSQEILDSVNKKIENTIFEIKKCNAEKEKTAEIRKDLEEFKTQVVEKQEFVEERVKEKIKRNRKRKFKSHNSQFVDEQNISEEEKFEDVDNQIHIGDKVKLLKQDAVAEVLEIKENILVVSLGFMRTSVKKDEVEKISNNEVRKQNRPNISINRIEQEISKRKNEFIFGLDLRGKRADEALQRVMEYIDEAIMVSATEVRILHGKGDGILRKIIRDYLHTVNVVASIRDEKIELGGAGISVVKLQY